MDAKETCETCYYNRNNSCHRYPPVSSNHEMPEFTFPSLRYITAGQLWCGEYKRSDEGVLDSIPPPPGSNEFAEVVQLPRSPTSGVHIANTTAS